MRARKLLMILSIFTLAARLHAQGFTSGSTGADGPLNLPAGITTLTVPPDGKFNYTTISIPSSATLRFTRNALNTPVYLLATGNVQIDGTIELNGSNGTSSPPAGGLGGPGGFDGGTPGTTGSPPGAGHGPGGGLGGNDTLGDTDAGGGAYGTRSTSPSARDVNVYGSPILVPLAGGSGGGGRDGAPGQGGGGGGGAILIASTTRITIASGAAIRARGGSGGNRNQGSGGAIRLIAPTVTGIGTLDVIGGSGADAGGQGRIRIDTLDRTQLGVNLSPASAASVGSFMTVFTSPVPALSLIQVAGQAITEGTANSVTVVLPFGSPISQQVRVRARDFKGMVLINVVLIPDNGAPIVYPAQIDMSAGNPAETTVNVELPVNVATHVYAWTR